MFNGIKSIVSLIVVGGFLFALWRYFDGDVNAIVSGVLYALKTAFFWVANLFTETIFPAIGL